MTINITKSSIDFSIITTNIEPMLTFYRDVIGLPYQAKIDMPGGTIMHRLLAGESVIKILVQAKEPAAVAPPGGDAAAPLACDLALPAPHPTLAPVRT